MKKNLVLTLTGVGSSVGLLLIALAFGFVPAFQQKIGAQGALIVALVLGFSALGSFFVKLTGTKSKWADFAVGAFDNVLGIVLGSAFVLNDTLTGLPRWAHWFGGGLVAVIYAVLLVVEFMQASKRKN